MIDRRLERLVAWIEEGADAGDTSRAKMRDEGHAAMYRRERMALVQWR